MNDNEIKFRELPIANYYGPVINKIYYVIENNRSKVIEKLHRLPQKEQDQIIDLVSRIATVENFKSPKIKYNLKKYNFGEIKPKPHRFFFFQKCGKNYIFFDYQLKKKPKLDDKIYKEIEQRKKRYEAEFKKYMQ